MAGRGGSPLEAALGRLGGALGCSRCHNLLKKPVNLGNCEHVFCLSCVVDCVGTACPVCHIPSRVQDVKVNRQLDNIARLYRRLQRLQGGDHSGSGSEASSPWKAVANRGKNRQIKMWFSPHSGKMRFQHLTRRLEKPEPAVADQESQPPHPSSAAAAAAAAACDIPSPSQEPSKAAEESQLQRKSRLRRQT
ncbi:BRCA1-associated RING domain protein 1 [Sphaerodactylus townsendi]|uniref:BRCA1-associated RING domain protein 1 n=1 Tax=Sphaerodactylus townsendi TaxID=933632 RepID=UPI002025F51B|nr:BRCA1-associated RING domain protein 1 [Sphaerodactylus townsendi]